MHRVSSKQPCTHAAPLVAAVAGALLVANSASAALVAQYSFDEDSGPVVNVANPGTWDGTLMNATSRVAAGALAGKSLYSQGNNTPDYVAITPTGTDPNYADPLDLNNTSPFTVALWLKLPTNPARFDRLVSNIGYNGGFDFQIDRNTSSQQPTTTSFTVVARSRSAPGVYTTTGKSANLSAAEWLFLAATFTPNGGGGTVAFYAGSEAGAVAQAGLNTAFSALPIFTDIDRTMVIGTMDPANPGNEPIMYMDNLRIYADQALSATELDALRLSDIPEPTMLGLLGLGSVVALARRRMR